MTIRQFARLCGCNPQTLRYYDHVGLLKPARVDRYSGYRFYDEEQALDFVKIRNLQSADFTIAEIKELLGQSNEVIWAAFERKIVQQKEKLKQIRLLQKSYQTEMTQMKQRIAETKEKIRQAMQEYDPKEEFGIDEEAYQSIVSCVDRALEEMDETDTAPDWPSEDKKQGGETDKLLCERHGWRQAREFMDELPSLTDGMYELRVELTQEKTAHYAFVNCLINLLLLRNPGKALKLHCDVKPSQDGQNHFYLFRQI